MIIKKKRSQGFLVLLLISFLMPVSVVGQQVKNIVGTVTDGETGKPVGGISVKVKRTNVIVFTNADGKYGLKANNKDILIFSGTDYETRSLALGTKTVLNVLMKQKQDDELKLVDIGYGLIRKRESGSAMAQVRMGDLVNIPVESFDQALAGRLTGVQVSSTNGQPGTIANIVVRGNNSLLKSSTPLYVIDGTALENPDLGALNPEEIESINVLKDAGATAIYGSRGANGVVLIQTKRGKVATSIINFNAAAGFQQPVKQIEMMNPYDFVKYQIERSGNQAKQIYTPAELATSDPLYVASGRKLEDYRFKEGIDWQDKIFRNAPIQNYNISIRGGDLQTRYALSGSMFDQEGIIVNSGSRRYQGRVSLDQTLGKSARIGLTLNYSRNTRIGEAVSVDGSNDFSSYVLYRAWAYRPISGVPGEDLTAYNTDPLYSTPGSIRINPEVAALNAYRHSNTRNLFANTYLEIDIVKNLQFRTTGSINTSRNRLEVFNNSLTPQGNANNTLGVNGTFGKIEQRDLSVENILTYTNTFEKFHNLTVLAGYSYRESQDEVYGFSSSNLPQEKLGIYGLSEGVPYDGVSKGRRFAFKSYFGRANYNYKSKYLLSATLRADESYHFAKRRALGYSPSVSLAWNMKPEDFMSNLKAISASKIRFSFGAAGNNRIEAMDHDSFFANSFVQGGDLSGLSVLSWTDPYLLWESTKQLDLGYDLSLFNDRIGFNFDYYRKVTGFSRYYTGMATVKNSGFEFNLNTVNLKGKNFNWSSNFNISFNKNEVLELAKDATAIYSGVTSVANADALYISKVGAPIGQFYGYIFDGIYQTGEAQPGFVKYRDLDENGIIDDNDKTVIGSSLPKHIGGFFNNFSYKAFDLNVFLQWSYGNDIYNANRAVFEGNPGINDVNQYADYANRWSVKNASNEIPMTGGEGSNRFQSTRFIEDGSYIRIKSVSLSYALPKNLIKPLYLTSLKFHVSAQNLWTFTKYTGLDPEVSARHSVLTSGFDYSAYPQARTISFGINAAF
jgi:TonB-linked SusC/RagA family outer membrane protein